MVKLQPSPGKLPAALILSTTFCLPAEAAAVAAAAAAAAAAARQFHTCLGADSSWDASDQ